MLDATRHVATVFLVTALRTEAAAAQSVPMHAAAQQIQATMVAGVP